ncbi:plasmid replication protein RepC [Pseudooceanicola sp. MF1-13]|uniref:plasmid replication protein RepC n=1 Tax=Pseudooceanicola sp. MF1-13 TaxID=3379095 RepID=UPI003892C3CF
MTHITTRFRGRPVTAAPDDTVIPHDKWALVDDLTLAAADYQLSHRSIAVLRMMLTFLPERTLTPLPGRAIVFASNATLGARMGGMPESTLRRHLAALVNAGVITRCDSPNRKRFARRLGDGFGCAYGFDLGRLAMMAHEISERARQAEHRAQEHAALRCAVLEARQNLLEQMDDAGIDPDTSSPVSALLGLARLMLRRKDNNDNLRQLLTRLKTALNTSEISVSDSENERHQHKGTKKDSEASGQDVDISASQKATPDLDCFREYQLLFPNTARSWSELSAHARQLIPMMGIDVSVYEEATRTMGEQIAAITALHILERFDVLRNPGGFLRHLTQKARLGRLDPQRLLTGSDQKLSADNFGDGTGMGQGTYV